MTQEYLILSKEELVNIKQYKPSSVSVSFDKIEDSDCWVVSYSKPDDNMSIAEELSLVNDYIVNHFHVTIIKNDSAAKFHKSLFPMVNTFERNLRKLLYLKGALNPDEKGADNINALESMDLGTLFELLFTDDQFIDATKKEINKKSWKFTKQEIIRTLNELSENTLWDRLFPEQTHFVLRSRFLELKGYRNDVMHAHNINYETYIKAKELFSRVNKEISQEISNTTKENEPQEFSDFNEVLYAALDKKKRNELVHSMAIEYVDSMKSLSLEELYERSNKGVSVDPANWVFDIVNRAWNESTKRNKGQNNPEKNTETQRTEQ